MAGHVLVVCTGNVCRSPFIQLSLSHLLSTRFGHVGAELEVVSAGTHALSGSPAEARIVQALEDRGVEAEHFRAQQLTRDHIERAGLVVAAAREHRAFVARMNPRALRRVFTLRQVARLLADSGDFMPLTGDPAADLAVHCASVRGTVAPSAGVHDDVPDPWQQSEETLQASVDLMTPAIEVLAEALASTPTQPLRNSG